MTTSCQNHPHVLILDIKFKISANLFSPFLIKLKIKLHVEWFCKQSMILFKTKMFQSSDFPDLNTTRWHLGIEKANSMQFYK